MGAPAGGKLSRMGRRSFPILPVLLATAVLAFGGCAQPGTDPDAAVRTLLEGKRWQADRSDPNWIHGTDLIFNVDGSATIRSQARYSWSYKNSTLTIRGPNGTDTTVNPAVTATTLTCNYDGFLIAFTTASNP